MNHHKFIVTGPPGVGKTTAIAAISEIPIVDTDTYATDDLAKLKEKTTVAMDYGELTLDNGQKLRVYGTPGQERFNFMWDILSVGALGLLILIDNSREQPFDDLRMYLDSFSELIQSTAVVIGVTRSTEAPHPSLDDYIEYLAQRDEHYPVFEVDIRRQQDVLLLFDVLISCLEVDHM